MKVRERNHVVGAPAGRETTPQPVGSSMQKVSGDCQLQ